MESYIPFKEQQREEARRTDLAAFLRQQGEEVKRSGTEFVWLDHGQRVTIRGNLWFHQYEQVGGDAIDFACRFYGMGYTDAVQLMLAMRSMGVGAVQGTVEPFAKQPLELPPKHENMRRVYGYLIRRRGIDKDVLDAFAYRGLVYESADYHNAVFVGTDRDGQPRHIHKHSTAAQGASRGTPLEVSRSTASTGPAAGTPCFCLKPLLMHCPSLPCTSKAGKARVNLGKDRKLLKKVHEEKDTIFPEDVKRLRKQNGFWLCEDFINSHYPSQCSDQQITIEDFKN